MSCLTCGDGLSELRKLQEVKDLAKEYAKKHNIKTMEIVKTKGNGSYSWKVSGEPHQHEIVEYLFV